MQYAMGPDAEISEASALNNGWLAGSKLARNSQDRYPRHRRLHIYLSLTWVMLVVSYLPCGKRKKEDDLTFVPLRGKRKRQESESQLSPRTRFNCLSWSFLDSIASPAGKVAVSRCNSCSPQIDWEMGINLEFRGPFLNIMKRCAVAGVAGLLR